MYNAVHAKTEQTQLKMQPVQLVPKRNNSESNMSLYYGNYIN